MKPVPEIDNCPLSGFHHHHYPDGHVSVDGPKDLKDCGVSFNYDSPEEAAEELGKYPKEELEAMWLELYRLRCMECD